MVGARNLFAKPEPEPTAGAIIRWWESRRLHYNVITLAWGFLCITISYLRGNHVWLETPLAILTYLGIQLAANIWYTGGWMVDLIVKKVMRIPSRGFGPWALALGIGFSFLFILVVAFL